MAEDVHLFSGAALDVYRRDMTLHELVATDVLPLPFMPVSAANLYMSQLAILTNARVVPLLNGEVPGRDNAYYNASQIRAGSAYHELTDVTNSGIKAASHLPVSAERVVEIQRFFHLDDALFAGAESVAQVHNWSLHRLHLPGSNSITMSGLRKNLGRTGALLMENLGRAGDSFEYVLSDGRLISTLGLAAGIGQDRGGEPRQAEVLAPGHILDDPEDSTVFGYGRNPKTGVVPDTIGTFAMAAFSKHTHGLVEVQVIADGMMLFVGGQENQMALLDDGLARTKRDEGFPEDHQTRVTLIDTSGMYALVPETNSSLSQYDLISFYSSRRDRKITVGSDQMEQLMGRVT